MYTQCPQCQTVYSVTIEMLRQAGGQVECGECRLRFNALPRLSETVPTREDQAAETTPQSTVRTDGMQTPGSAQPPDPDPRQHDADVELPHSKSDADAAPGVDGQAEAGATPLMEQRSSPDERQDPAPEQTRIQDTTHAGEPEPASHQDDPHAPHPGSGAAGDSAELSPQQDETRGIAESADLSAERAPDDVDEDTDEYDTWLRHLDREWDPTQTGTEDAWSRAAPQVDPPPDAADSGEVLHLDDDAEAQTDADRVTETDNAAQTAPTEDAEQAPAIDRSGEQRSLDTGISYIESWAEDLLAEAERAEDATPAAGKAQPEPVADASAPEIHTTDASTPPAEEAEHGLAAHPAPDFTGDRERDATAEDTAGATPSSEQADVPMLEETGTPATADADADQAASPDDGAAAGDQDGTSEAGPLTADEPAPIAAQPRETSGTPAGQADIEAGADAPPEPDAEDKWLEETWATDTQSFQPEVWLEPDFVDQDPLPEKLEGAGEEAAGEDHAATDPAIQTDADRKKAVSDEIAGLWPELDDDAEVEEIVLESSEPGAAVMPDTDAADNPESAAAAGSDGRVTKLPEKTPTPPDRAADAAAVAAAGKVQAAAVKVTTGTQTEDQDAWPAGDDAAGLATRAEEVAIELGLPHRRPWIKWAVRLIIPLALLILIAAGVHSQHGVLMRNASIAPVLEKAYGLVGISVQPTWDITAFDILDSSARSSDEDLIVSASFINRADFAQPYPVFRVTLENRWGQAIGQEDFLPRNYLRGYSAGRKMRAGERSRAEVILRSPGAAAEGFSVDLCLASVDGSFRCLADRP